MHTHTHTHTHILMHIHTHQHTYAYAQLPTHTHTHKYIYPPTYHKKCNDQRMVKKKKNTESNCQTQTNTHITTPSPPPPQHTHTPAHTHTCPASQKKMSWSKNGQTQRAEETKEERNKQRKHTAQETLTSWSTSGLSALCNVPFFRLCRWCKVFSLKIDSKSV